MLAKFLTKPLFGIALSFWVVGIFFISQVIVGVVTTGIPSIRESLSVLNNAARVTLMAALAYGLTVGLLVGAGKYIRRFRATRATFGLGRSLTWSDLGIGMLSLLPYFILSAVVAVAVANVSGAELNQNQALPFDVPSIRLEFILAFFTLVIAAPIAEELVFRGYYYGKLREKLSLVSTIVVSAAVFGLLHLPGQVTDSGIDLQTATALDTFVLGLVLGTLREFTGSVWAGIILHMGKNAIAFFLLFIYPSLGGTL